jgi:hypothetical protein
MKFALSFNKPAVTQFIDTDAAAGIKVKIENGVAYFKPVKSERGAGVFPITGRTRGGVMIDITGKFADEFMQKTGMERGSHMTLTQTTYGWLQAESLGEPGVKTSKLIPTARLWRSIEEAGESKAEKAPAAPARASRKSAAKPAAKKTRAKAKAAPEAAAKPARKQRAKKAAAQAEA